MTNVWAQRSAVLMLAFAHACVGELPKPAKHEDAVTTQSEPSTGGRSERPGTGGEVVDPGGREHNQSEAGSSGAPEAAAEGHTGTNADAGSATAEAGGKGGTTSNGGTSGKAAGGQGGRGGESPPEEPRTCPYSASTSACDACIADRCGTACDTCAADDDCYGFLACADKCPSGAASMACIDDCRGRLMDRAAQRYSDFAECGALKCRADCNLTGIGDPCKTENDCAIGSCSSWGSCTRACETDADCGTNSHEIANVCIKTQTEKLCLMTCTTQNDCAAYPGLLCINTGSRIVCAPGPFEYVPASCASCTATQCRSQEIACAGNEDCIDYVACKCSDDACNNCIQALPESARAVAADFYDCAVKQCKCTSVGVH